MEGRRPPPKASHPFPNNPDLTKFWGTPYARGFFKSYAFFMATFGIFSALNMYMTRHEKGPLGMDVTASAEELKMRRNLLEGTNDVLLNQGLPLEFKYRTNIFTRDPKARFDDGLVFNQDTETKTVLSARSN